MLVLTQNAYESFSEELKFCKYGDMNWRCIILKLSLAKQKPDNWFTLVADKINTLIGNEGTIYLFPDDDVFVFSRGAVKKSVDVLYQALEPVFQAVPQSLATQLYELPVHADFVQMELSTKKPKEESQDKEEKIDLKLSNPLLDPDFANIVRTLKDRRMSRRNAEILVSEDDPFSSRLVCKTIDAQFASHAAYDGRQTLESYLFNAPDALFLDIGLPDMNGLEILSNILSADPDAYIVIISANGNKENVLKAIESGAKGFIAKPFTREKIFQYLERCPTIQKKTGFTNKTKQ